MESGLPLECNQINLTFVLGEILCQFVCELLLGSYQASLADTCHPEDSAQSMENILPNHVLVKNNTLRTVSPEEVSLGNVSRQRYKLSDSRDLSLFKSQKLRA